MAIYKNVNTGETVEAELLTEDQGVRVDDNGETKVDFAAGNWVLVYEDGTIKVAHPIVFEREWREVA
jgi:hypothetical protein